MLKELYSRVVRLASHPYAEFWLFLVAFIESSVFPIPPDVLLLPMVLVRPSRAFRYAFVCTLGSVVGGVFGYTIGHFFYETVGTGIIGFYGIEGAFEKLRGWYGEYDVYIVGVAGFSPIPYKIFTITSGLLGADMQRFILASVISRAARFGLEAWLLWRGGRRLKTWIEYNLNPLTMAASVLLIMAIVLIKLLVEY